MISCFEESHSIQQTLHGYRSIVSDAERSDHKKSIAPTGTGGRQYETAGEEKGLRPGSRRPKRAKIKRLVAPSLASGTATTAATSFSRLVAVATVDGAVAARLKGDGRGLSAARANHRSSLCGSRPITTTTAGSTLLVFPCLPAVFATFGSRVTTFLKERLIRSGEGEFLPAIAARKLNISGHGIPRKDCTACPAFCA
jgi:hypothetical protein